MDSDSDQRMDSDSENEVEMDEAAGTNSPNQNIVVGKIVEVYLKNFLTHTEATVHPSEQLNLVSLTTSSSSSCSSPVRFILMRLLFLVCNVSTFAQCILMNFTIACNDMKLNETNDIDLVFMFEIYRLLVPMEREKVQ